MKVGIFILFLLYFRNGLSESLQRTITHGKSPKKNLPILISRKFFKPINPPNTDKRNNQRQKQSGYTAFPAIGDGNKKLFNVPDSPYFPIETQNLRARIKKVLPDYSIGGARRKRAVSEKENVTSVKVAQESKPSNKNKTSSRRNKLRKKGRRNRIKNRKTRKNRPVPRSSNSSDPKAKPLKYTKKRAGTSARRNSKTDKKNKTTNAKSAKNSKRSRKDADKSQAVTKKALQNRRLIAAKDALIEDYPYVVSIQREGKHWCSGALLNPRLVITTANCVWRGSHVSRMKIRAGSSHTDSGGQIARIQEMYRHPGWNIRSSPDNDVALLLLDRRIKFSHKCHAVDLPNRRMMPAFEDAWVASWGADRRDGIIDHDSIALQAYHARVIDRPKCNNVTQRFGVAVTDNFICLSQTGKTAPCTRDTGAPAVSDGILWGLASWGIRKLCGTQRFPAMFSYMASPTNMDFITNATHQLMADERFYPFPDRYVPPMRADDSRRVTPGW